MFRTSSRSIIIPAELHEKIAEECPSLNASPSEVVAVRPARRKPRDSKNLGPKPPTPFKAR